MRLSFFMRVMAAGPISAWLLSPPLARVTETQVWGGTAAAVCTTVFVKPIMSCPQDCISDVR